MSGWSAMPVFPPSALTVAVDVGRRRRGDTAVLRALHRRGEPEGALPAR